jgi:hypothetical protein
LALQGNRKRERFDLDKRESTRKLSDAQRFSKVYYKRLYKGPVALKWEAEYLAHYNAMKTDATEDEADEAIDAKVLDKQIQKAMRKNLKAGLLDVTVSPAEQEDITVDGDPESYPNGDKDEDGREGNDDDEDDDGDKNGGDDNATDDHFKVPVVPLWFQNAVMKVLWDNASKSEHEAVREHERKEGEAEAEADVGGREQLLTEGPGRIAFLHRTIRFVSPVSSRSELSNHTPTTYHSRRMVLQTALVRLLEQIYEETAYVGSVCLAGPDPERGGKLMTTSYVCCTLYSKNSFILLSRIHLPFKDSSNFGNAYGDYQAAVSDPLRAFSTLFFRTHFWFPSV